MATRGHLLPHEPITTIDQYLATETGALGVAKAQEIGPEATRVLVERAGLRGRGGGGFPTGRKWSGVTDQEGSRRYLVCNGAEGEPGTFKDRALMRANPYQLVEGVVIAAFAVGAQEAFIAMKSHFTQELEAVTRAVQEMQQAGICSDCTVNIVGGPDEYLFGEEKALLEVIEGGDPLPRLLPPYEHGLFATAPQTGWEGRGTHRSQGAESNPTVVNNVETLSNVPHILARGDEWFRSLGTDKSPGTQVCTVVGDVAVPGVAEVELGTPLREVLDEVGGGPLRRTDDQGGVLRCRQPGRRRREPRCAAELRGLPGHRQRHGCRRLHRVRRHRMHGGGGATVLPVPVGRVMWPVHRVQARLR